MNSLDTQRILQMLPHRYPFLLVDRVLDTDGESYIETLKNVTVNEPFFQGHFPGKPVFPGVLLIEAMAQSAGLMLIAKADPKETFDTVLLSVDRAKFRHIVTPGDQLHIRVELIHLRATAARFSAKIRVGDALAAECEMLCALVKPEK